jgi:hypothetical protein
MNLNMGKIWMKNPKLYDHSKEVIEPAITPSPTPTVPPDSLNLIDTDLYKPIIRVRDGGTSKATMTEGVRTNGEEIFKINVTGVDKANSVFPRLIFPQLILQKDTVYQLSFCMQADLRRIVVFYVVDVATGERISEVQRIYVASECIDFVYNFTVSKNSGHAELVFSNLGEFTGELWINQPLLRVADSIVTDPNGTPTPTPTPQPDSDGDGINDHDEKYVYGTDPDNPDSDNDGLPDKEELDLWGEHWSYDFDEDGLINIIDSDNDEDGFYDMEEIQYGVSPFDPTEQPQTVKVWIEAESGATGAEINVVSDPEASDNRYIHIPQPPSGVNNNQYTATFTFDVPAPGFYLIWGRIVPSQTEQDPFFIISNAVFKSSMPASSKWMWKKYGDNGSHVPQRRYFDTGTHTVKIEGKKGSVRLDKLLITNNSKYVPKEKGGMNYNSVGMEGFLYEP